MNIDSSFKFRTLLPIGTSTANATKPWLQNLRHRTSYILGQDIELTYVGRETRPFRLNVLDGEKGTPTEAKNHFGTLIKSFAYLTPR